MLIVDMYGFMPNISTIFFHLVITFSRCLSLYDHANFLYTAKLSKDVLPLNLVSVLLCSLNQTAPDQEEKVKRKKKTFKVFMFELWDHKNGLSWNNIIQLNFQGSNYLSLFYFYLIKLHNMRVPTRPLNLHPSIWKKSRCQTWIKIKVCRTWNFSRVWNRPWF